MRGISLKSSEAVKQAVSGIPGPRPVAGPLAVHYCAGLAGVSVRQYTTDARTLADCVIHYYDTFHPDAVWVSADTWVTAQAMGAAVDFPGDDQPMAGTGKPLIKAAADIDRIPPPEPASQGRWPLMLEAIERVKDAIGDQAYIVACFDQYPFSLACALMGMDQLMLTLFDDPVMVDALLQRCLEYTVAYGKALSDCGADMLSGGDSPAGLVGPARYRQVALPYEQRAIEQLRVTGGKPVSLHICGDTTSILVDMATSGAHILELDHHVDVARAAQVVGEEVAIWGNLDPVSLLVYGTTRDVQAATCDLIESLERVGHRRYVVSSGCTLAMETPPENLRAMLTAVREFLPARRP